MASLQKEIREVLNKHKSLKVLENGKVLCQLSGHEMPCRLDALEQYIAGKKYQKLSNKVDIDLGLYKEFLEPNAKPGHEHQLFCKLTWKTVNYTPEGVKIHVLGKKFQRALKRWEECQKNGTVFKTAQRLSARKIKEDIQDNNNNDDDDGWESDDSYSDLFPEEHFKSLNLEDNDSREDIKEERGLKRRGDKKLTKSLQTSKAKRSKH